MHALPPPYADSGTDIRMPYPRPTPTPVLTYACVWYWHRRPVRYRDTRCCAMCGTETGYAATRRLCCYA
eukprot:2829617-Rhodomonas_salina.1